MVYQKTPTKFITKCIREKFLSETMHKLKIACIDKAIREMECGLWDDLKQLRLDGVISVCDNVSDISLSDLATMFFQNGLKFDFALVPKEKDNDLVFTDIGSINKKDYYNESLLPKPGFR